MKIICAGQIKTGTKSLSEALRTLGYSVCDVDDQLYYCLDEWYDLYLQGKKPDFRKMLFDVDVIIDVPGNIFYEEIMEAFPDAKVILTIRDEESWAKSVTNNMKMIYDTWLYKLYFLSPTYRKLKPLSHAFFNASVGSSDPNATYIFRLRFRQHNDRVKAVVPADKLLVLDVARGGWKPLCDFLGHEVPSQPFPHENIKGAYIDKFKKANIGQKLFKEEVRGFLVVLGVVGALALGSLLAYRIS